MALVVLSIAVASTALALAQAQQPAPAAAGQESAEEVIVRGKRLTDLRFEVQVARERAYNLFNNINSNDEFDVYCREEGRTGTRSTERVCRPQFESRISADAAREYLSTLFALCQPSGLDGSLNTQACMFGNEGQSAKSSAQAVEARLPGKREQMTDEIFRLARENDEFARAILDWYEANQRYQAARPRRRGN